MAERDCCWLGPGVEHLCLDGIPLREGQTLAEARWEREVEAQRRAWEREHNPEGRLLGPRHPDREPIPYVKPLPQLAKARRRPKVGPPALPVPRSELLARLEVAKPDSPFGWGEAVRGWESLARLCQAMSAQATTGLEHALAAQDAALDVPPAMRDAQAVVDEVAHLTQSSITTSTRRVDIARALATKLPATWAALASAKVSWGAVCGLVDATEDLTHAQAALVEADLWPAKHHHTPAQILDRTRTLIAKHAPDVVKKRQEHAATRREARLLRGPQGGTDLVELEAPAEEMAAFWTDVETLVARQDPAAERSKGERRLDAIIGAVRIAADTEREQPGFSRTAAAKRGLVHVTIDWATLFGFASEPGRLRSATGTQAVTAETARRLAWDLIADAAPVERIVIHGTTGTAARADLVKDLRRKATTSTSRSYDQDPTSAHLTVDLDRQIVARDQHCTEPDCDQPPSTATAITATPWTRAEPAPPTASTSDAGDTTAPSSTPPRSSAASTPSSPDNTCRSPSPPPAPATPGPPPTPTSASEVAVHQALGLPSSTGGATTPARAR